MPLTVPDQDIAGQFKQPDMLNTMKSIAELKNQQQTLKTNQLNYQISDTANQKLNRLRDIAADPTMRNPDGSYNQQRFSDATADLGPDSQETQGKALDLQSKGTSNAKAGLQLTSDQQQHLAEQLTPLLSKKDLSYNDAVDVANKAGQMYGLPPEMIKQSITNMPTDPTELRQFLKQRLLSIQGPTGQAGMLTPKPEMFNTGGSTQVLDSNPTTNPGIIGTSVDRGLSAESAAIRVKTVNDKGQEGTIPLGSTVPQSMLPNAMQMPGAAPQSPTRAAMQVPPDVQAGRNTDTLRLLQEELSNAKTPEDKAALQREIKGVQLKMGLAQQGNASPGFIPSNPPIDTNELMEVRKAANQAAATVGDSRNNNDQIRAILANTKGDFVDPTGAWSKNIAHISGWTGFSLGSDAAENYNSITHYLALQQQTRNQQMGVKTDAGSAISGVSSGSPDQDRKTLTNAINISDAGNTGMEKFNEGMEASIKKNGISSVRDFKNLWSQNYDVNALRLANAHDRGDKQEAIDLIKELGGVKSENFKIVQQHLNAMDALSEGEFPKAQVK